MNLDISRFSGTREEMADWQTLRQQLKRLEGCTYGRYKSLQGRYEFPDFELTIDYVQGDPFASPSRIHLQVSSVIAQFPSPLLMNYQARVAIADYLTRQVVQVAQKLSKNRGSGRSGQIDIASPSQAVLRRTAIWIEPEQLEVRLTVGLPAQDRRIAGVAAAELLCEDIPALVNRSLTYAALDAAALTRHIHTFEDAEALRSQLEPNNLVAFVAAGACLPRRSGIDERSLLTDDDTAERFSPPTDASITLETPHSGPIQGLGIPAGVTLIVGGGYHGKSTLLNALEHGIYNHIPDDGREQVVACADTVKLRAEDGRSVVNVNISPIINHLPKGRSSERFSTACASGSTSQAAGLIEAMEAGAKVILIDEDTAATNFMIRDRAMQTLIPPDKEPITPFIDKVRQLYDEHGISSILVMGSSGDYFAVADTVIAMDNYQPKIVTQVAKAIAQATATQQPRHFEGQAHFGKLTPRAILATSLPTGLMPTRPMKVKAQVDSLKIGDEIIDLRAVEQLIEASQVRAIAQAILYAQRYYFDGHSPLATVLDQVMSDIQRGGLDALSIGIEPDRPRLTGDLAEFRRFELAAAINRLRSLQVKPIDEPSRP
jgi:predicted ABC-class ATPase